MSDGRDVRHFAFPILNRTIDMTAVPCFGDEDMLPQVTAFMLESQRWRPVSIGGAFIYSGVVHGASDSALGFAHRTTRDVVWKDYLIPKGATVIGNHWYAARSVARAEMTLVSGRLPTTRRCSRILTSLIPNVG